MLVRSGSRLAPRRARKVGLWSVVMSVVKKYMPTPQSGYELTKLDMKWYGAVWFVNIMRTDSRLAMFHKIYHHQVAIVLPQYLLQPTRLTRHMHPFSLRQIHTGTNFFKFSFFPHTVVLWNSLPHNIAVLPDADSFKRAVGQLAHS